MTTFVTRAAILGLIALEAFVIHLRNAQLNQRLSALWYGRLLPELTDPVGLPARRDHREGGRGRLRPHHRLRRRARGRNRIRT
ncbi:hypothetical protein ACGFRG_14690 [Streptomyces sp. NPDC048696]|uniref:hypothetical protein n=1 Tax=Streptomyces sp. NPDC048696 TaxID=3365585 RepID=UPI00370FA5F0